MACWALRTDKTNKALILRELLAGRLRQGWGWLSAQDLRPLAKKVEAGKKLTNEEKLAWRNHAMLGDEDGIQIGHVLLLPNLPEDGQFLLTKVTAAYEFERIKLAKSEDHHGLREDYGHQLGVEPVRLESAISYQDERVPAGLRRSLTCRSRCWSLERFEGELSQLLATSRKPGFSTARRDPDAVFAGMVRAALDSVSDELTRQLDARLQRAFAAHEVELPCRHVLQALYPEAKVEATGGPGERGADLVVTWEDPLVTRGGDSDLSWCLVVQVKDWRGEATDTHGIDQLCQAREHWQLHTQFPVRGAVLLTLCDGEAAKFRAYRLARSEELGIPLDFVDRARLLGLFRELALSGRLEG